MSSTKRNTTLKVAGFTSAGDIHEGKSTLMNWEFASDGSWNALGYSPLKCTTKAGTNIYYPPTYTITGDIWKNDGTCEISAMHRFFGEGTHNALKTVLTDSRISANLGQVRLLSIELFPDYSVETGGHHVALSNFEFGIIPPEEIAKREFDNKTTCLTGLIKKAEEMLN